MAVEKHRRLPWRDRLWLGVLLLFALGTGLTGLAFLLSRFQTTRFLVGESWVLLASLLFVLVPLLLFLALGLELWARRGTGFRFRRLRWLCYGFLLGGWLAIAPTGGLWAYIFLRIWEPWPLTLAHGPDTQSAHKGFKSTLWFDPPETVSAIYYYGFSIRDGADHLRFDYGDPAVFQQIIESRSLTQQSSPDQTRSPYEHQSRRTYGSWWTPELIAAAQVVYGDGHGFTLWIDEARGRAYVESLQF